MGRPRKRPEDDILIAKESASVMIDGEVLQFRAGVTRIRASHPAVKANPHLFEPLEVHYDVEQATAAPGEKRGA